MPNNAYVFSEGPNFWIISAATIQEAWKKLYRAYKTDVKAELEPPLVTIPTNKQIRSVVTYHARIESGANYFFEDIESVLIFVKGQKKILDGKSRIIAPHTKDVYGNIVWGTLKAGV